MQSYNILSQVQSKRLYRHFVLRSYLTSVNTNGLYSQRELWRCSQIAGIPFNTLKKDIEIFTQIRLIEKNKGLIILRKLPGGLKRLYDLFKDFRPEIESSEAPAIYFSDLYKKKIIFSNVIAQAINEAAKIKDHNVKKKFLQSVRNGKNSLGVREGIKVSLRTVARIFGRYSPGTAHRYIERMHVSGLIRRFKNSRPVESFHSFLEARRKLRESGRDPLYGRLFIERGLVYERLQNSYQFNF